MTTVFCSLGHTFDDSLSACPVCGEKRPEPPSSAVQLPPPNPSTPLIIPAGAFGSQARHEPEEPPLATPPPSPSPPPAVTEDAALDRALQSDLPTIAIVGFSNVGKSFFITRINDLTYLKGYRPDAQSFVDGRDQTAPIARPAGEEPAPGARPKTGGRVIELTTSIELYEFRKRGGPNFRLVDIPGEIFAAMMGSGGGRSDFLRLDETQVRKLWKVIARAQAFIVLVPATELILSDEALGGANQVEVLSRFVQPLRDVCWLLDSALGAAHDDLAEALSTLQKMTSDEKRRMLHADHDRLSRPLLLLYSKADEVLGAPATRSLPEGREALVENADFDPMLVSGQKSPGFLRQLCESFATFKIDFVTAYAGLPADGEMSKVADPSLPHHGVWSALTWTLRALQSTRLPVRQARETAWLLSVRRLFDSRFRKAF